MNNDQEANQPEEIHQNGLRLPVDQGLYSFRNEHDACGVGMVANLNNQADHGIIEKGVTVLKRLMHRGASGGDPETGDGAGILFTIPDAFFRRVLPVKLPAVGKYGVAMIFGGEHEESIIEKIVAQEGCRILFWRDVPIHPKKIGAAARKTCPTIRQLFIGGEEFADQNAFERRLFVARRQIEKKTSDCYIPSCSSRSIVYKGLLLATQLDQFYPDLSEKDLASPLAIVHQRYSTNTFPTWKLAHPFRFLAHNGEINTLRGNLNQLRGREPFLSSPLFGEGDMEKILPLIDPAQNDSACLDNMLELLVAAGRSLPHAMLMLMPQAWGQRYHLGRDVRGFFDYHSAQMEPWDGPAAVAFTDGRNLGAMLDRNGLRPARYTLMDDGLFVLASETGVLDLAPEHIVRKGRLKPGAILWCDLEHHRLVGDAEMKNTIARQQPYRRWAEDNKIEVNGLFDSISSSVVHPHLALRQRRFGWSREDIEMILQPMANLGKEPTGSMGNDAALAVLSDQSPSMFNYFKQLFAQVTNPPIDPIREELVMSLTTYIGNQGNILSDTAQCTNLIRLARPVLTEEDLRRLSHVHQSQMRVTQLRPSWFSETETLEAAISRLREASVQAVEEGCNILILSDRELSDAERIPPQPPEENDADLPLETPIPILLATAAVNGALVEAGLRPSVGLIVHSGEVREIMHFALLLGYGATAICPYLAFETVAALVQSGRVKLNPARATANYIAAVDKGLLKIMSKMGISTLRSYRSAQIFEAVGLDQTVIDRCFPGTVSRIGGVTFDDIATETMQRHHAWCTARKENDLESNPSGTAGPPVTGTPPVVVTVTPRIPTGISSVASTVTADAHGELPLLPSGGQYRYRKDGENHLWTPQSLALFREAVQTNNPEKYRAYAKLINDQAGRLCTLRGLIEFAPVAPVPLAEVEPIEAIVRRFVSGAMSLGSLSPEAHETIAIAMNRLGAMSNCGEGGEDPEREKPGPSGENRRSAIRQVASGRFGVTIDYLAGAKEIQIKMAQGAKPGEGGQLPGHKVDENIARVRHSMPFVTLISPPPHHDIYSIEDLAQLIFDLRNSNREARVSVKLVSEVGVGTIAAGVAKAHSDVILISGHDGGTGASPLTSIKHAGLPWELGLAETQQTLVLNRLRGRVRLQVDGQLKTGRDVMIGALLGAEEFGFATTLLVCLGCVMMRKCHDNSCPAGVATQDPALRRCFRGKPEYIENFLRFVAGEVREYLAKLGFRTLDEAIGRSDRLQMNHAIGFYKTKGLDFTAMLLRAEGDEVRFQGEEHPLETFDDAVLIPKLQSELKSGFEALRGGHSIEIQAEIRSVNRTAGTRLSSEIARKFGANGLPDDTIRVHFTGYAGQSFGAFLAHGVTFVLEGEANDFVGKGISGGKIVIRPPKGCSFRAADNVIAGNVIGYGGTSGRIFLGGQAGERFAIRNSGFTAVVEGIGDHGCEYMTGGRVVVVGPTGVNFAAGMTGGIAYVFDESNDFDLKCNVDTVDLESLIAGSQAETELLALLAEHVEWTGSEKVRGLLADWSSAKSRFIRVIPIEYKQALLRQAATE